MSADGRSARGCGVTGDRADGALGLIAVLTLTSNGENRPLASKIIVADGLHQQPIVDRHAVFRLVSSHELEMSAATTAIFYLQPSKKPASDRVRLVGMRRQRRAERLPVGRRRELCSIARSLQCLCCYRAAVSCTSRFSVIGRLVIRRPTMSGINRELPSGSCQLSRRPAMGMKSISCRINIRLLTVHWTSIDFLRWCGHSRASYEGSTTDSWPALLPVTLTTSPRSPSAPLRRCDCGIGVEATVLTPARAIASFRRHHAVSPRNALLHVEASSLTSSAPTRLQQRPSFQYPVEKGKVDATRCLKTARLVMSGRKCRRQTGFDCSFDDAFKRRLPTFIVADRAGGR